VIAKHEGVRALLGNGWMHLWSMDDRGTMSHRYTGGLEWAVVERTAA